MDVNFWVEGEYWSPARQASKDTWLALWLHEAGAIVAGFHYLHRPLRVSMSLRM